ncbi:MAG: hypothetical protein V4467_01740 [Patescibacteria group bacterium]
MSALVLPAIINGGAHSHRNGNGHLIRAHVLSLPIEERTKIPIGLLRRAGLRVLDSVDPGVAMWAGTDAEFAARQAFLFGGRGNLARGVAA